MGTHLLQLLGQFDVVFQRILVTLRVKDIPRIAHGSFADGVGTLVHRLHGDLHPLGPVQGVKDAENVNPRLCRLDGKFLYDVVGVVGIADSIRTAQQHLEEDVRHFLAQALETLPGVLGQKTHRNVVSCTAPHLQGEEPSAQVRRRLGDAVKIVSTEAGRHQRLVGIPPGRICNQQPLVLAGPVGKAFWALVEENVAGTARMLLTIFNFRHFGLAQVSEVQAFLRLDPGIAVNRCMADETEDFVGAVLFNRQLENLGVLVEK